MSFSLNCSMQEESWSITLVSSINTFEDFLKFSKLSIDDVGKLCKSPQDLAKLCDKNIDNLIEALEVRFLANQDKNLHFGLLTDFKDAIKEKTEEDEQLIQHVSKRIIELNEKYPGENKDTFFLFHRPRKWNPNDRIWMGYERKRGKLSDLNSLLRGETGNRFSVIIGRIEVLKEIKFSSPNTSSITALTRCTFSSPICTKIEPLSANNSFATINRSRK